MSDEPYLFFWQLVAHSIYEAGSRHTMRLWSTDQNSEAIHVTVGETADQLKSRTLLKFFQLRHQIQHAAGLRDHARLIASEVSRALEDEYMSQAAI